MSSSTLGNKAAFAVVAQCAALVAKIGVGLLLATTFIGTVLDNLPAIAAVFIAVVAALSNALTSPVSLLNDDRTSFWVPAMVAAGSLASASTSMCVCQKMEWKGSARNVSFVLLGSILLYVLAICSMVAMTNVRGTQGAYQSVTQFMLCAAGCVFVLCGLVNILVTLELSGRDLCLETSEKRERLRTAGWGVCRGNKGWKWSRPDGTESRDGYNLQGAVEGCWAEFRQQQGLNKWLSS